MKKLLLLIFVLFMSYFSFAQIDNGRFYYRSGSSRQVVEITDTHVLITGKRNQLKKFEITERRKIEKVDQIICDLEGGSQLVISNTTNGKNLFMYKRTENDKDASDVRYWAMKRSKSHRLRKALKQTKNTTW